MSETNSRVKATHAKINEIDNRIKNLKERNIELSAALVSAYLPKIGGLYENCSASICLSDAYKCLSADSSKDSIVNVAALLIVAASKL